MERTHDGTHTRTHDGTHTRTQDGTHPLWNAHTHTTERTRRNAPMMERTHTKRRHDIPDQNGTYKRWRLQHARLYIPKYFFLLFDKKRRMFIFNKFFENGLLLATRVQSHCTPSLLGFRSRTAPAGWSGGGVPGAATATADVTAPAPVVPSSSS
jgi:hypothetical protein